MSGAAESGAQCANAIDDDGDGWVNDGCPQVGATSEASTPELCDGIDNDLDGQIDEGYDISPANGVPDCTDPAADTDGDTIANPSDTDDDNDGFSDTAEIWIGTDSLDACADNAQDPAWPPDITNNHRVDASDILKFRTPLGSFLGGTGANDYNYDRRFDLYTDAKISVSDVIKLRPSINTTCTQ
jgi:hypothetical protein